MLINGELFRDMIISGANNIENHKQAVNDLNVFPVPDGDTGTNMSLTMLAAKKEIENIGNLNAADCAEKVANAVVKGARGNSGVILSLFFRGMAKYMKGNKEFDGMCLANAAKAGVDAAYKAVMKPTEGTILTVARLAADDGLQTAQNGGDALEVLTVMLNTAEKTLVKTPDMLPVLKQANVVDAGGEGYCIILKGMLSVLRDKKMIEVTEQVADTNKRAAFESFTAEDIKFTYCTEFMAKKRNGKASSNKFKKFLNGIGDSIVAVDDDGFLKVHIHTNNPGKVIEEAILLGDLSNIKIENMKEQHTEITGKADELPDIKPQKQFGFVVVSAGEGFEGVFKDLGVDNIVKGGQTMNPSTDEILKAIGNTPAGVVFVLPNNKNIILAAEQAAPLTKKEVIVIPSKTIPQGITALFAFDGDVDKEVNKNNMTDALSKVKTVSVTYATRDSVFEGKTIKKGQILGLIEGNVRYVEDSVEKCVEKLANDLLSGSESFVNIFYGEGVDEKSAVKTKEMIEKKAASNIDVNVINGGQPIYYYIISAE